MDNQTKIKATLFITGAIIFSMLLASIKVQAQESVACDSYGKKLYTAIQIYHESKKTNQLEVDPLLLEEVKRVPNHGKDSFDDKVHTIETRFVKCYFNSDDELEVDMSVEQYKKSKSSSFSVQ